MKIFFTGSMSGGRMHQPAYEVIIAKLQEYGEVTGGAHVASKEISQYGETELSREEIHDREIQSVDEADVVVADVSSPSFGVGYLVCYASMKNKKIICLSRGPNTYKLSAMIKGDGKVKVFSYEYDDEISKILEENLK